MPPNPQATLAGFGLAGQVAVVTGATSGIGRATAVALARVRVNLPPADAMDLIRACAKRFPGGQMVFDLPPVLVKKFAPKGMRSSSRYRVPPMPFSLSAAQLADLVHTVPGVKAVDDLPMPQGRGFMFERVFPAFWQLKLTKNYRGAYTLLEFG